MSAPFRIEARELGAAVRAFTTTRAIPAHSKPPFDRCNLGGTQESAEILDANRALVARTFGLPGEPRWLRQVHGASVHLVDEAPDTAVPIADASISRMPARVLAILTADCVPIVIASADRRELAAIHAGWRGLAAGVIEVTLAALSTPRAALRAWIGPAIGAAHYEVGRDVHEALAARIPAAASAFIPARPGHWQCDLAAIARASLIQQGLVHVSGGGFCTYARRDLFYSHRRDGTTGRMATFAWLES